MTVEFNVTTLPAFTVELLGVIVTLEPCTFIERETIPELGKCDVSPL